MIRECFRVYTGIQFYRESLKSVGLNPDTLLDMYPPAPTPSPARVAQFEAAVVAAEPSDGTLVDLTEESVELEDARSPIHDELKIAKAWWILELLPMRFREQILMHDHYKWKRHWKYVFISSDVLFSAIHTEVTFRMNLGRGRTVPESVRDKKEDILVHRSVKTRMDIKELKYKPKVNFQNFKYKLVDQ